MPAEDGNERGPVRARTEGEVLINGEGMLTIRFEERDERSYTVPAARNIVVTNGQKISAGTPITAGQRDPQDVLRIQGREAGEMYLVREGQRGYRNTGVYIHDKKIQVI